MIVPNEPTIDKINNPDETSGIEIEVHRDCQFVCDFFKYETSYDLFLGRLIMKRLTYY